MKQFIYNNKTYDADILVALLERNGGIIKQEFTVYKSPSGDILGGKDTSAEKIIINLNNERIKEKIEAITKKEKELLIAALKSIQNNYCAYDQLTLKGGRGTQYIGTFPLYCEDDYKAMGDYKDRFKLLIDFISKDNDRKCKISIDFILTEYNCFFKKEFGEENGVFDYFFKYIENYKEENSNE